MERVAYDRAAWRDLPRSGECAVSFLFGDAVGPCGGLTHRHHVDPEDPDSRSFQLCARHHPKLQAALRHLHDAPVWKRCQHAHPYPGGREECERKLNGIAA